MYQPFWSNGLENIDKYHHDWENEIAKSTSEEILIIGENHNAHTIEGGMNGKGKTGVLPNENTNQSSRRSCFQVPNACSALGELNLK